jgi:hypothetical protein
MIVSMEGFRIDNLITACSGRQVSLFTRQKLGGLLFYVGVGSTGKKLNWPTDILFRDIGSLQ